MGFFSKKHDYRSETDDPELQQSLREMDEEDNRLLKELNKILGKIDEMTPDWIIDVKELFKGSGRFNYKLNFRTSDYIQVRLYISHIYNSNYSTYNEVSGINISKNEEIVFSKEYPSAYQSCYPRLTSYIKNIVTNEKRNQNRNIKTIKNRFGID